MQCSIDDSVDECKKIEKELADTVAIISNVIATNEANENTRNKLIDSINKLMENNKQSKEALDIATHAIEILQGVSNEAVVSAYEFIEENLNTTLGRMFSNTTRKIKIKEFIKASQYPQLTLELDVGNGIKRTLKNDSGHGLAQIVSILCILCLIVITGSRRLVLMDEVLSGVSAKNRMILDEVMWTFTAIGFQFIVNDHGYIVKGSQVYCIKMENEIGKIVGEYIADKGQYLQSDGTDGFNYLKNTEESIGIDNDITHIEEDELSSNEYTDNSTYNENEQTVANNSVITL